MGTTRLGAFDPRAKVRSATPLRSAWTPPARTEPAPRDPALLPQGLLVESLRQQVLPRLLQRSLLDDPLRAKARVGRVKPSVEDIETVARLTVESSPAPLSAYVERMLDDGFTIAQLYGEVLTPAARRLGVWWEHDGVDFAQVTLGTSRLHRLVHDLSPHWRPALRDRGDAPSALIAAMPGSQHTFGVLLLAESFRRAGWAVWSDPSANLADLERLSRRTAFDLIGLSVSTIAQVGAAGSVILSLLRCSRAPEPIVMIGGPQLRGRSGTFESTGAQIVGVDAPQALQFAECALVERRARLRRS